jgi:hypothetical protein
VERKQYYLRLRDELRRDIEEARAIVTADEPQHENPFEDLVVRGIWEAVLDGLNTQLEAIEYYLTVEAWHQEG